MAGKLTIPLSLDSEKFTGPIKEAIEHIQKLKNRAKEAASERALDKLGKDAEQLNVVFKGNQVMIEKYLTTLGGAGESTKKNLAEMMKMLQDMSVSGMDQGSPIFRRMQEEAASLTDTIGDIRNEVKLLSSDTVNLDFAIGTVKGLTGAFSTGLGIIGMFTDDTEKLQRVIAMTNSAMTVMKGLQTISNTLNKSSIVMLRGKAIAQTAYNSTVKGLKAISAGTTASLALLKGMITGTGVASGTARIAVIGLKVAIKGLMISTGVGIAIWALCEAIEFLMNKSEKAKDKTKELTKAEEEAKRKAEELTKVRQDSLSELILYMAKLKDFKGSKEDEKKLVDELNNKYGDTLGYYKSVSEWYDTLCKKSAKYAQSLVYEAKARHLANEIAAMNLSSKELDALFKEVENQEKHLEQKSNNDASTGNKPAAPKPIPKLNPFTPPAVKFDGMDNDPLKWVPKQQQVLAKTWEMAENLRITNARSAIASLVEYEKKIAEINKELAGPSKTTGTSKADLKKKKAELEKEKASIQKAADENAKYMDDILAKTKAAIIDATVNPYAKQQEQIDENYRKELAYIEDVKKNMLERNKKTGVETIQSGEGVDENIVGLTKEQADALNLYLQSLDQKRAKLSTDLNNKRISDEKKDEEQLYNKILGYRKQLGDATLDVELEESKIKWDAEQKYLDDWVKTRMQAAGKLSDYEVMLVEQRKTQITAGRETDKKTITQKHDINTFTGRSTKINELNEKLSLTVYGSDEYYKLQKDIKKLTKEEQKISLKVEWDNLDSFEKVSKMSGDITGQFDSINSLSKAWEGLGDSLDNASNDFERFCRILDTVNQTIQTVIGAYKAIDSMIKILGVTQQTQSAIEQTTTAQTQANAQTTIAAKTGESIASATAEGAKMPFPMNLVAIAAGIAAVIAAISMIGRFAQGGVIQGNTTIGDHNLAYVNAGEMIMNNRQQARLWNILNGSTVATNGGLNGGNVKFELTGSNLYGCLKNYSRVKAPFKDTGIK